METGYWFVAGLVLLFAGGELVVRGAVGAAERLKVSRLLIGLVVVACATSSPELVLSLKAVAESAPEIAIGNVVGSNIANILLVLGFGALLMPVSVSRLMIARDGAVLIAATAFLLYVGWHYEEITPEAGILLIGALSVYLVLAYIRESAAPTRTGPAQIPEAVDDRPFALPLSLGMLALGVAGLLIGADLLVDSSIAIAEALGVPEAVIAISMIAVGTSLPELATILIAAMRKHSDIAVGAILGSNIFNILAVLGITALVEPVLVDRDFYVLDFWVMGGTSLALVLLMMAVPRIGRVAGLVMLLAYAAYMWALYNGVFFTV
ncbi:MAG: calcium/sodium antiporter [Alphaproteobacteria bacterium]|nr:calcium/sodium antiporter [Alphaproteobacteria bacterium]